MASKTALPIARLRALGARVHTVIGHSPNIGEWIYGVMIPRDVDLSTVAASARSAQGDATMKRSNVDGENRLIVAAHLYRVGSEPLSKDKRDAAERDVAALLSALADTLNGRKF